ncbi:TolB family protein, partial [Thermogutta sp.]|uniref:TolB family protein n=1 Tax=Thermogutta sp. TaxID=1962930 RepID=UPI003C7D479B
MLPRRFPRIWRVGIHAVTWIILPHLLFVFGPRTVSLSPGLAITVESLPEGLQLLKVCDKNNRPIPCSSATAFGFFVFAKDDRTQLAVMPSCGELVGVLGPKEQLIIHVGCPTAVAASVHIENLGQTDLEIGGDTNTPPREVFLASGNQEVWEFTVTGEGFPICEKTLIFKNPSDTASAVWKAQLRYKASLPPGQLLTLTPGDPHVTPPPELPPLAPPIEVAMIEWDWRLQDGLNHPHVLSSQYGAALNKIFDRGQRAIESYSQQGLKDVEWLQLVAKWNELQKEWHSLQLQFGEEKASDGEAQEALYALWLQVRRVKRQLSLRDPALREKKVAFIKHVPSVFSHQLTQYTGNCARPGGGVYLLDSPDKSMACTDLTTGQLPRGSFEFCDVSPDGTRLLFSFCAVESAPANREQALDRFFHLYEIVLPQRTIRQLTSDPYDDFGAKYLPDGRIIFVSTRRGGFHRCGQGPCPVHTLTLGDADGRNIRVISFHETHEWDPVPLLDGRILYTRWDYVDRNAVFYQQLWTVRSNGEFVQAYYGNNTFNPVGIWEARPIPGTNAVIATAAPHHAMTAGSIIRVDIRDGQDGPQAITRLTPDALFPESEVPVPNRSGGRWFNPVGVEPPPALPPEQARFPGHCYRTPYPLSETTFLAAYSYDSLIGEPDANQVNMFGLYWMDIFGNKELLYRDLNVSSLWPVAFTPSRVTMAERVHVASKMTAAEAITTPVGSTWSNAASETHLPANSETPTAYTPVEESQDEGIIFLANVYAAWPHLPKERITRLRIIQVLPKSTWHANQPMLGVPNISPGKQVLGSVPVEADGS